MGAAYEVLLGPAAIRLMRSMEDPAKLAHSLSTELADGPNADKEVRYDGDVEVCLGPAVPSGAIYTATPLSVGAYTAIHRPLTRAELARLRRGLGRRGASRGFYVLDILPAESAFIRRLRPLS